MAYVLWSILACENVVAEGGEQCGVWVVVRRGDLPTCRTCKRPDRNWRVVLPEEIEDFDRRLLRDLRIAHLGAVEQG